MRVFLMVLLALSVVACKAPVSKAEQEQIAAPVNCATAANDIKTLEAEKARVGKEVLEGVSAFTPIGLVAGVATKTEKEKVQVASGDYNKMIDQKVADIKTTCGIQ